MIFLLFFALACQQTHYPKSPTTSKAPENWKKLLLKAVQGDKVDYDLLIKNQDVLEQYMTWIATHGPLSNRYSIREEKRKICYYANAYNAAVVYGVLQHWPITSVKEVESGWFTGQNVGFFLGQQFVVDGDATTLFHLEHDLILGQFQDPRLHAMLNCASKGCPPLRYWETTDLDQKLEKQWGDFIQKSTKKHKTGWSISEMFFWYQNDILDWSHASNLCIYVSPYLKGDAQKWMRKHSQDCPISSFPYDWSLND